MTRLLTRDALLDWVNENERYFVDKYECSELLIDPYELKGFIKGEATANTTLELILDAMDSDPDIWNAVRSYIEKGEVE